MSSAYRVMDKSLDFHLESGHFVALNFFLCSIGRHSSIRRSERIFRSSSSGAKLGSEGRPTNLACQSKLVYGREWLEGANIRINHMMHGRDSQQGKRSLSQVFVSISLCMYTPKSHSIMELTLPQYIGMQPDRQGCSRKAVPAVTACLILVRSSQSIKQL